MIYLFFLQKDVVFVHITKSKLFIFKMIQFLSRMQTVYVSSCKNSGNRLEENGYGQWLAVGDDREQSLGMSMISD